MNKEIIRVSIIEKISKIFKDSTKFEDEIIISLIPEKYNSLITVIELFAPYTEGVKTEFNIIVSCENWAKRQIMANKETIIAILILTQSKNKILVKEYLELLFFEDISKDLEFFDTDIWSRDVLKYKMLQILQPSGFKEVIDSFYSKIEKNPYCVENLDIIEEIKLIFETKVDDFFLYKAHDYIQNIYEHLYALKGQKYEKVSISKIIDVTSYFSEISQTQSGGSIINLDTGERIYYDEDDNNDFIDYKTGAYIG